MDLTKGLFSKIEGLRELANEKITGVQFYHSEQGQSVIEPEEGSAFTDVLGFAQMVENNGVESMFDGADTATLRPNDEGTGQILALGRNVGSNG